MTDPVDPFGGQLTRELFEDLLTPQTDFQRLLNRRRQTQLERLLDLESFADREAAKLDAEQRRKTLAERSAKAKLTRRLSVAFRIIGRALAPLEAVFFEVELIRALREKEDFESLQEEAALNEWIRQKLARRSKEKQLRTTGVLGTAGGSDIPGEPPNGKPTKTVLQDPTTRPILQPLPAPDPIVLPGGIGIPGRPDIDFEPDIPDPRAPAAGQVRVAPVAIPLPPLATPGIKPTTAPSPSPTTPPALFRSPLPRPRLRTLPKLTLPSLTPLGTELVRFPQVSPRTQTQTQPQLQETSKRQRKSKCYKGLYKEKRDGSITKTRWARIDCDTGEEVGDRSRTRKKNQVDRPNGVQPHLASLQGFSIRPG